MRNDNRAGFTLLELMIVMEIIALLASLAIPALLRQRIQTNEAAAVQNLRTLGTAQISFNTVNLRYGTMEELSGGLGSTPYVDGVWANGVVKSEYRFNLDEVSDAMFVISAQPVAPGKSGIRTFSVDASGEIKMREAAVGG